MRAIFLVVLAILLVGMSACATEAGTSADPSLAVTSEAPAESATPTQEVATATPDAPPVEEGDSDLYIALESLPANAERVDAYLGDEGCWWALDQVDGGGAYVDSLRLTPGEYGEEELIARLRRLYPAAVDIAVWEDEEAGAATSYPCTAFSFGIGGNEDLWTYRGICLYTDPWEFLFVASAPADWMEDYPVEDWLQSIAFMEQGPSATGIAEVTFAEEVEPELNDQPGALFEAVYRVKRLMAMQFLGDEVAQSDLVYQVQGIVRAENKLSYAIEVIFPDGTSRSFAVDVGNQIYELVDGEYQWLNWA